MQIVETIVNRRAKKSRQRALLQAAEVYFANKINAIDSQGNLTVWK